MKSLNKTQIAIILGSLALIVLLLLANTKLLPKEKESVQTSEHANPNSMAFSQMVKQAIDKLSVDEKKAIEKLDAEIKTATDKKIAFKNMIRLWDSLRNPSIAAYYKEQLAETEPTESNWMDAGKRYTAATRFVDEASRPLLFEKAIVCYERVLALNPNNVDAKIDLASSYVEASTDPMKGIGMLREIEKTDSNNVNLQLTLAFFSEKSGQWNKAIARFEKVLVIKPDFIEAYLHLADAYQQKGDKAKTIESLKKYAAEVDDVTIKAEVQDYINKLNQEKTPEQKK